MRTARLAYRAALAVGLGGAVIACSPQAPTSTRAAPPTRATTAPSSRAAGALPSQTGLYYTFTLAEDLSDLSTEVCFVGPRPPRLLPPTPEAASLLRSAESGGDTLGIDEGIVSLTDVGDGACVTYLVDTVAALDAENMRDGASRVGDDALLSPDWWLWAPDGDGPPGASSWSVHARFVTTTPMRAEMPWPTEVRGAYDLRIPPSAFIWRAQGGFTHHPKRSLSLRGGTLDVSLVGDGFGDRRDALNGWLKKSAEAVTGLLDGLPLPRAQVLLVSAEHRNHSYGYVLRGGGPSATMLMPSRPTDAALAEDWTAVHELFHFSHPAMRTSEAWFFEGLATYFTALARAQSGMTSKRYGWWELLDGFERGKKVGTGVTLREECKTMHENGTHWRIYWSGAMMLLTIDVALRKRGQTLPALVSKLAKAKLDDTHRWTAEELMARLDEACGCDVPSRVTRRHLDSTTFPSTAELTKKLGVQLAPNKSVTYDDAAPDVAIRRAIMGGD